jgi:hypothetical protein
MWHVAPLPVATAGGTRWPAMGPRWARGELEHAMKTVLVVEDTQDLREFSVRDDDVEEFISLEEFEIRYISRALRS